jgi:hypothetical protein
MRIINYSAETGISEFLGVKARGETDIVIRAASDFTEAGDLYAFSLVGEQRLLYVATDTERPTESAEFTAFFGQAVEVAPTKVAGIVQIDGTPAGRIVRVFTYDSETMTLLNRDVTAPRPLGETTSDPETGEYEIIIDTGYTGRVFVVAFDDYGPDFTPEMSMTVGDRVHPTTPNGHVFIATSDGQLPAEEPEWVVDTETSQLYGTASMIARPFYRPMVHGPVTPEITEGPVVEPEPLPESIGEPYGGGFYAGEIEDGGKTYKLIVADISGDILGLPWMDPPGDWPIAASSTDGLGNTQTMAGDERFAAGNHCLDWRGGGFDDWYMPAQEELSMIYLNLGPNGSVPIDFRLGNVQAFDEGYYWCSTENESGYTWIQRFSDGYLAKYVQKDGDTRHVRPVRRVEFTPEP